MDCIIVQFAENHQPADPAILQSLALRSRMVLRFFSGNSSCRAYTSGEIACQFSTAHVAGQDCSPRSVAGDHSASLSISLALERDTNAQRTLPAATKTKTTTKTPKLSAAMCPQPD